MNKSMRLYTCNSKYKGGYWHTELCILLNKSTKITTCIIQGFFDEQIKNVCKVECFRL